MNYEQESDKAEVYAKALDRAYWLISLKQPDYPFEVGDEELLAKQIFKAEMKRRQEGKESLFTLTKPIPDKSVPDQEEEDFWNV